LPYVLVTCQIIRFDKWFLLNCWRRSIGKQEQAALPGRAHSNLQQPEKEMPERLESPFF
jgi:hypothetical protein